MIQHAPRERFLAIALAGLAGFVDAIAFLELGGYFVSFMTGNTTRLGASLRDAPGQALIPVALIVLFVAGVVAGTLVRGRDANHPATRVMTLVACLLLSAGLAQQANFVPLAMAALALAMGAENAVFARNGEVSIGVTYMTGTLVKMGQRIAAGITGGDRRSWLWYFMLWTGLAVGAFVGALAYGGLELSAIWIAATLAGLLAVLFRMGPKGDPLP